MDDGSIRRRAAVACVGVLAAALGGPVAGQDGDAADGDAPSVARSCLNRPFIKRTRILNDRNIVFVTRDDVIYNNQLPRQCPSLKRGSLVNYPIANDRLCAGGSFQVLWEAGPNNRVPAFVCRLGYFVPITESELEDLEVMTDQDRRRRPSRRSTHEAVTTEQVQLPSAEPARATSE